MPLNAQVDLVFEGFKFDRGKAAGLGSEALDYTNPRSCSKCCSVLRCDTSPCRLRLSPPAVRTGAHGYPDSREVPGITCFSQPILILSLTP